ncbi:leucyl/phenylalanyl-tRNA--protein transferase [Flavobacterium arcticum]|uniref:Leucyl/phenylalanyl-tRNA--protein transferase n=1 Tax=Flavobacterium arcticum TaxID=1784713 RepID=A0A345HC01_9FLAO|nr:leucyl/phenylalanyl-tRNA--protein transferase [Flavobacterium arcticum]AXG74111.1 leucyl/phenylalanyl-tRNA--protein transferase [Flavobacterium arcticum]KAF2507329.1 leucyl/phenylalanyl-tRNA--protein transferase [Flavobacterium arcticum]
MYFLSRELYFPSVYNASPEGIVAIGGDLTTERLLLAYRSGIFPWFEDDEPILWWSPPERMVLFFEELKISKSMRNVINRGIFKITYNTAFKEVITNCRSISRNGQDGTWITEDMIQAYTRLHELGYAKSVEVWQDNELVGGLYGIDLGTVFCGESMFSKVSNASKIAFIALAQKLKRENYRILDCQVHNSHLESLGAREIDRETFIEIITN